MDADTVARLNVTVEAFVKRCLSSRHRPPFALLEECLGELQTISYWSAEEIEQVRSIGTRVLNERLTESR
jgi:hypothetical protein